MYFSKFYSKWIKDRKWIENRTNLKGKEAKEDGTNLKGDEREKKEEKLQIKDRWGQKWIEDRTNLRGWKKNK